MANSQNGWPAGRGGTLDNRPIPSAPGVLLAPGLRPGPVAIVLRYVAERFTREVEALRPGWCWGYAYREVRGGGDVSNHGSASFI